MRDDVAEARRARQALAEGRLDDLRFGELAEGFAVASRRAQAHAHAARHC
jgi:hypothetical protein